MRGIQICNDIHPEVSFVFKILISLNMVVLLYFLGGFGLSCYDQWPNHDYQFACCEDRIRENGKVCETAMDTGCVIPGT